MPKTPKNGTTAYVSRKPDNKGFIHYSDEENAVWHDLISRQIPMLPHRACKPWIDAMHEMNFPISRVPQLKDISQVLKKHTGWSVTGVPALIGFTEFFTLLANKQFPVATFIRTREDFDYIQEPDIFHEVFGHTPR
jgi:phenylalanine-4-hydroxylase